MKKIISIILICLFLLSLTACGNKPVYFEESDTLYYGKDLSVHEAEDDDIKKDFLKMLNRCDYEEITYEDIVHIKGYDGLDLNILSVFTDTVCMYIYYGGDYLMIAERSDPGTVPRSALAMYDEEDAKHYRITDGFELETLLELIGEDSSVIPTKDTTPLE